MMQSATGCARVTRVAGARLPRVAVAVWFAALGNVAIAQPANTDKGGGSGTSNSRYALVIGNSAYQHIGVLPNPANDAREMAEALKRIDVQVDVVIDANRETMVGALNKLSRATEFADLAIVHYSGHGIEISGKNYLLPTGVQLNQPSDADSQAVAFEQVYAAIGRAPGVKLILLDACRDNPLPGRLGLPPRRGLASPSPPRDTLVAYATRHGEVEEDGPPGSTSPFTGALVRNISRPVDIRIMFQKVRDDVLSATEFRQAPFTYGHFSGADYRLAQPK
jgi:uncharacterized caspase-like protein